MATDPVPDPIDEELERLLADPEIQADLKELLDQERRGKLERGVTNEEVRRRFGLPPADPA